MAEVQFPEFVARRIFEQAITEGRAAELLVALFDGAGVTLDAATGALVVLPVDAFAGMFEDDDNG